MGRSLRCCLRQLQHLTGINVTFPKHEKDKEINNYSLGKYYFIKNNCFFKSSLFCFICSLFVNGRIMETHINFTLLKYVSNSYGLENSFKNMAQKCT